MECNKIKDMELIKRASHLIQKDEKIIQVEKPMISNLLYFKSKYDVKTIKETEGNDLS